MGCVALGTSHYGILTADGSFLTWGRYNSGALGLGDPRNLLPGVPGGYSDERSRELAKRGELIEPPGVLDPFPVNFDRSGGPRRKFVLSAAVGEHHCGALVIDLEENEEVEAETSGGWLTSVRQMFSGLVPGL